MSRRKKKKSNHVDESWLLPYSDMLTLLVALFIVLFASSNVDAQKFQELAQVFRSEFSSGSNGIIDDGPAPGEALPPVETDEETEENEEETSKGSVELANLQEMQEGVNQYITENELIESLETSLTNEGLLITILDNVFFDPGSAEVKEEGIETAIEVSKLLYSDPPHQVVISGHTDDVPMHNHEFSSNWELSVERGVNFMSLVLQNEKLDPTLFSVKGYGEYKPLFPNNSDENRAKNRRVEVLILPNYEINVEE
ncbi:flagellar motor protein MotB [Oceanobacillus bengalensis]|uniref:Flagellar motor protein MotB n=1 Tax=Oceanobacillus bengalensis TaxID=1435466 RepID=A0A494Z6J0_9BACI|nr:flagellar motor protein MotB [Oceanobacillus bengalensis]RKQ18179.1 flagellar motor protein MotB [Oceanobacillus bengalensis]